MFKSSSIQRSISYLMTDVPWKFLSSLSFDCPSVMFQSYRTHYIKHWWICHWTFSGDACNILRRFDLNDFNRSITLGPQSFALSISSGHAKRWGWIYASAWTLELLSSENEKLSKPNITPSRGGVPRLNHCISPFRRNKIPNALILWADKYMSRKHVQRKRKKKKAIR